jgi:L-seryl-tRNA(Ser) seleniumtransferase
MQPSRSDHPAESLLRQLPSVDHLLRQPVVATLLDEYPRGELLFAIRAVLDERRREILAGQPVSLDLADLGLAVRRELQRRAQPSLRRVINATGIVLHTGLGRAPLAAEAVEAVAEVAAGYSNLEVDLETGQRGDRQEHLRGLLRELTGAEDGLVVNNNAAATFLTLQTLARGGREVIVSRGQLVEIGGSYRMPDIMAAAGCRMVEVGTTNRTRISDYERCISEATRVLLRVHTSNYRIQGFVEHTPLEELVRLARSRPWMTISVVDDLGSGLLADVGAPGWDEPTVRESVQGGADVTLFSGDKLLGGPQAGIIVGRRELLLRMHANPLLRTFRPDKMTLAALEATLRLYRDPEALLRRLPALRMLLARSEELESAARRLEAHLRRVMPQVSISAGPDHSYAGGGSLPTLALPTWTVTVTVSGIQAADLALALRRRSVPVIARIRDESLLLDVRTLLPDDQEPLAAAVADAIRELTEN